MTSRKLNTDQIANELAQGSVFFHRSDDGSLAGEETTGLKAVDPAASGERVKTSLKTSLDEYPPRAVSGQPGKTEDAGQDNPASSIARTPASKLASTHERSLARFLAESDDLVEAIHRTVKRPGRETSYVRMTEREKAELTQVIGSFGRRHGSRVSETDVMRIALCALLADYTKQSDESLLVRVIAALKE